LPCLYEEVFKKYKFPKKLCSSFRFRGESDNNNPFCAVESLKTEKVKLKIDSIVAEKSVSLLFLSIDKMKPSVVAIAFAVVIALSNALPVPEESSSTTAKSDEDTKTPSVSPCFIFHNLTSLINN